MLLGRVLPPLAILCVAVAPTLHPARGAESCENGDALVPGQSCELALRWDYDHWIVATFEEDEGAVEFRLTVGACSVALTGPLRTTLGPEQQSLRSTRPGEYHLFLRGISAAQQACVYHITVE